MSRSKSLHQEPKLHPCEAGTTWLVRNGTFFNLKSGASPALLVPPREAVRGRLQKVSCALACYHIALALPLHEFALHMRVRRCQVYHKNLPMLESQAALLSMQTSGSGVLVCTDAAARGLDIQNITHVIQSDFAPNAIDFIHRIGRTARADKGGKVTSLFR